MKKLLVLLMIVLGSSSFKPFTHIPGHVSNGIAGKLPEGGGYIEFTNSGITSSILAMNNTTLPVNVEKVGFHIALISLKEKYIPIAYDVVPFENHEKAEGYVMKFAISRGLAELPVEQYSLETIKKAEDNCTKDKHLSSEDKEEMLLVIRQTQAYMKTEYFKKIYLDGSRVRNPQEVLDWISSNTILDGEIAREELSKQPLLFKNR